MPTLKVIAASQAIALAALLIAMFLIGAIPPLRAFHEHYAPYLPPFVTATAYLVSAAVLGAKQGLPFDMTTVWVFVGMIPLAIVTLVIWFLIALSLQPGSGFH